MQSIFTIMVLKPLRAICFIFTAITSISRNELFLICFYLYLLKTHTKAFMGAEYRESKENMLWGFSYFCCFAGARIWNKTSVEAESILWDIHVLKT